jgi:flagellar biosynthesis/type III secretory pathway protein FliH
MPLDIVVPIRVKRIEKSAVAAAIDSGTESHAAGYTAGFEQGRLRAEFDARRQREQDNVRVEKLVRKLENLHREYEHLVAEHLPDLITGALKRIYRQHPFTTKEIGTEVAALLREMEQAGRISLECCAADAEGLADELHIAQVVSDTTKWNLEVNETLGRGEFILKSDIGDVDGRHSTRIRQIHHALEASS